MPAYRHGATHLKKQRKRRTLAVKRKYRSQLPPGAEVVYHPYSTYLSRSGKRLRVPDDKEYYQVVVHLGGRQRLLYSTHREPYHLHLSTTYDVDDLAVFRTQSAAINAAWRAYHQDEDWRAAVEQFTR